MPDTPWGALVACLAATATLLPALLVVSRRVGCLPQTLTCIGLYLVAGLGRYLVLGVTYDELTYDQIAVESALASFGGPDPARELPAGKSSIAVLLSGLYATVGHYPVVALVLIALLGGLIPILTAVSACNLGWEGVAGRAAWIVVATPMFVYWLPRLGREFLVYLLLSIAIWGLSLIYKGRLVTGLLVNGSALILMAFTRSQLVGLIAALTLFMAIVRLRSRPFGFAAVVAATAVPLLAASTLLLTRPDLIPGIDSSETLDRVVSSNSSSTENLAVSGVGRSRDMTVAAYLYNFVRSIAGPLPWEYRNLYWIAVAIDGSFFVAALTMTYLGIMRRPDQRNRLLVFASAAVALMAVTAISLANFGIVFRIRDHALFLLVLPIAVCWTGSKTKHLAGEGVDKPRHLAPRW